MFRTPLCPSSGTSQLHMQSLVPCGAWFVVSSSPRTVTTQQDWRTQRTKHHTGPEILHVQLRSSWWWTQWCPKHVERNNVNKILRTLKQSTSSWHFYSKLSISLIPPLFTVPTNHLTAHSVCLVIDYHLEDWALIPRRGRSPSLPPDYMLSIM